MALKRNVTKTEYEKLPADVKKEYTADGEGFTLDVEGYEGEDALKKAKDHEKREAAEAKRLLHDAKQALETLQTEHNEMLKGNIPKGDHEKLEKSYQKKLADKETELNTRIQALEAHVTKTMVDGEALAMATRLSAKSPRLLLPHIKARMKIEYGTDGAPVTRILDKDGNISASTAADLEKEFLTNKDFSTVVTGSKASGGSAQGGRGGGSAEPSATEPFDYSKATPKQIAEHNTKAFGVGTEGFSRSSVSGGNDTTE